MWIVLALVTPLAAQTPADSAPRAVAKAWSDALQHQAWDSAAALVDSATLAAFRTRELTMILGVAAHRKEIVRVMSRAGSGGMASIGDDDTTMVAPLLATYGAWHVWVITASPTIAELAALSPRQLFARALASQGTECFAGHRIQEPSDTVRPRLIGGVIEGDSVAHLLYADPSERAMDAWGDKYGVFVRHLVRRGGEWRVIPRGSPLPNFLSLVDDKCGLVPPPAPATKSKSKH